MKSFVFVYKKENKYLVLDTEKCRQLGSHLVKDDWKHTHTIEASVWMQYILNCNESEIMDNILDLK